MLKTLVGVVREGRIELLEDVRLPEGTKTLVTVLPNGETEFWLRASQSSLDAIWYNPEDDVYGELLEK